MANENRTEITLHLQAGMSAEIVDGKVIISFDKKETKRDLWNANIEIDNNGKEWGYLILNLKDKLSYKKSKF